MLWEEGDFLFVNGVKYAVTPDPDDRSCAIVKDVDISESYSVLYAREVYIDGTDYLLSTYRSRQYRDDDIGQYANPMAGFGTTTDIRLHNLCGIMKVGVTGGQDCLLTSIAVSDNAGTFLDGYLVLSDGDLRANNFDNVSVYQASGYKNVELKSEEGVALSSEPKYFYLVLPYGTYPEGLSLTLEDKAGNVCTKVTPENFEITRSVIKEMEPFAFEKVSDISVTVDETTATSVSCTVGHAANSNLSMLLIYKSAWDRYMEYNDFESDNALAAAILNSFAEPLPSGNTGTTQHVFNKALNSTGNGVSLASDTDYRLLVAYSNGETVIGNVTIEDIRTPVAGGVVPELSIEQSPVSEDYAFKQILYNIKAKNATSIRILLFEKNVYDSYIAGGMTDRKLVSQFGSELSSDALAGALGGDGYTRSYNNLTPDTGYIMLAMAIGEGGAEAISALECATSYYVDPQSEWMLDREDACLRCGFFTELGYVDIYPVRVYRNSTNGEIIMIENPFGNCADKLSEAGYVVDPESDYNIIFDTRNGSVKVEYVVNGTNLQRDNQWLTLTSSLFICNDGSFGYDNRDYISLGSVTLCNDRYYFGWVGETILYMDKYSMPPVSPSMSTEDFGKDMIEVVW